jgi:hypothetical protein
MGHAGVVCERLAGVHPGRYRPPIGERDPLSAALWSLIDDRRILLKARIAAMGEMGLGDLVWMAETVQQMELLAALARELYAQDAGGWRSVGAGVARERRGRPLGQRRGLRAA